MIQRKQMEVLKKKLQEGQGKQKDFKNITNESIMASVMSVMGGNGNVMGSSS